MPEIRIAREQAGTLKSIVEVGSEVDDTHPDRDLVREVGDIAKAHIAAGQDNGDETVAIEMSVGQLNMLKAVVEVGSEAEGDEEHASGIWAVADDVEAQIDEILNAEPSP